MKVTADKNLNDLGYTWIVDGNECGGFLHSRKSDPFFDSNGLGTETIKLSAFGYGTCTFHIAYADPANFRGFETYPGQIISIPIYVLAPEQEEEELPEEEEAPDEETEQEAEPIPEPIPEEEVEPIPDPIPEEEVEPIPDPIPEPDPLPALPTPTDWLEPIPDEIAELPTIS